MEPSGIRLEGLTKHYPGADRPAVAPLDLDIPAHALTALVGPSGCGKTTILKMINRLVEPTGGRILIDGTDVRDRPTHVLRRDIGYVIQQVGLFPHRSVAANIATVPRLLGWAKDRISDRVAELAETVGLETDMLDRYPAALSGGQQQRVGVARALAADPPILLMDEPYSAVDPIVRTRLQDDLIELQGRIAKTIVFVTHDIEEALKLADQVALLNVGGILEQASSPDTMLAEPANSFVEEFLGAERGLRRLGLHTVASLELDFDGANPEPGPTLTPDTPLREALETLLASDSDRATVVDDDGSTAEVSVDDIGQMLQ